MARTCGWDLWLGPVARTSGLELWPGRRPKLFEWQEKVSALPAAQRVREEVMAGIEAWVTAKRFDPIKEQIAAHPELKWVFGRD